MILPNSLYLLQLYWLVHLGKGKPDCQSVIGMDLRAEERFLTTVLVRRIVQGTANVFFFFSFTWSMPI